MDALARVVSQVALTRAGVTVEAAREALGEAFDVAVEVVRAADGRLRVLRVAEIAGADAKGVVARDLFVLSADGNPVADKPSRSLRAPMPPAQTFTRANRRPASCPYNIGPQIQEQLSAGAAAIPAL